MAFDMMNGSSNVNISNMRSDYDLSNVGNNPAVPFSSFKSQYNFPGGRPHSSLTLAEQAELEYELRYRGNMIVDQQRKIQQLEEELRQSRDQVEMMNSQLSSYEQDRNKEKKKPQSRYWTPEEHQRFLEALQKYGHKDVKSISMHVSTRNATQVRTHAQKYFLRLERERRKKEEFSSGNGDGYNSSDSLGDDISPDPDDITISSSLPISALTLPGSPAVAVGLSDLHDSPGTPGDHTPEPGSPANSSPIPIRRRRATSFITVAQARLAAQARDSVLVGLPPTWTVEDYDMFMKGLLALADKQEDLTTLCRSIREQYLPHHTPDEVELCYRNVLKNIKQKPIVGSPKRRRTNSRPEPLTSSLGAAAAFANSPSFPVPPVSTLSSNFPFRNSTSNLPASSLSQPSALHSSYGSSSPQTPSSPLIQSQQSHMMAMSRSPYAEYGHMTAQMELPILSELNIGGLALNGPNTTMHQASQQVSPQGMGYPQHQQQGNPVSPNQMHSNVWGSMPFSYDTLMSGNVALPQQQIPLNVHN